MMECKNSRGHVVLPILYKVEPKDVGHRFGMFGERSLSHEDCVDEKVVDKWEKVLIGFRSLERWDSEKDVSRFGGYLLKSTIINDLSDLKAFEFVFTKHLVGIEGPREDHVILVYHNASINLIGIYGIGGIGKINFAKVICNCGL